MQTTFTIKENRIRAALAKVCKCNPLDIQLSDDGDGMEATIMSDDPRSPGRIDDMFKRWEKAAEAKPDAN
jgi:hypothetical protein